jgi:hypothetical protein
MDDVRMPKQSFHHTPRERRYRSSKKEAELKPELVDFL